jgi:predicted ATPase
MALSREMRLLKNKWESGGWPKRLESLEITGLRGWLGERIDFQFPIVAICGENGAGKSTVLQAAAASYRQPAGSKKTKYFASDFFPDTPWDTLDDVTVKVTVREQNVSHVTSVRKPTTRWRGNPERRERTVLNVDLSRTQPVATRIGYQNIAKPGVQEVDAKSFDTLTNSRLCNIMGRRYTRVKMALTDADATRRVPVFTIGDLIVSGFHQGAGELTMIEFLEFDPPKYSLVLIDEVETSLHPRSQRRLIRDLAELCREREIQVILTTHSPYVLEELPPEARSYIFQNSHHREIVRGVSPDFAMTMMDEEMHPDRDVYIEDERAERLLREVLVSRLPEAVNRCQFIRYGAASVGHALGQMVANKRFPRPSLVFVDGDQEAKLGCLCLPGGDAPERVVLECLREKQWGRLHERINRRYVDVADSCARAMSSPNHHDWVKEAADKLVVSGDVMWTLLCSEWTLACLAEEDAVPVIRAFRELLDLGDAPLATGPARLLSEPGPSGAVSPPAQSILFGASDMKPLR